MAEKETDLDEPSETDKENVRLNPKILSWTGPRTVIVPRTESGFGFTLRHFIVYPPESAVQALKETELVEEDSDADGHKRKRTKLSALEPMDTIFVKQVKDGGPAYHAGLNTGDRIVSVNGETVTGKTYSQVIALIQASDCQLKLLVVPKDEDILQMAYQSSAYNQGREAHRGSAREIPNPPPSTYSRFARMQSASYAALQNTDTAAHSKPALSPRFKAELQVSNIFPDGRESGIRNEARTRTSLDSARTPLHADINPLRAHSSTGSLPALGVARDHGNSAYDPRVLGLDSHVGGTERLLVTADSNHLSPKPKPRGGPHAPSAPLRTSSRVITLSHIKNMDKANSMESISRSSDSSHSTKHSQEEADLTMSPPPSQRSRDGSEASFSAERVSDDARRSPADYQRLSSSQDNPDGLSLSSSSGSSTYSHPYHQPVLSKSVTAGKLPTSVRTAQPYTRSHTTSALIKPTYVQDQQSGPLSHEYPPSSASSSSSSSAGTATFPPHGLRMRSSHSHLDSENSTVVSRLHDIGKDACDQPPVPPQNSMHRYGRVFSSDYDFSLPQSAQNQGVYVNGREVAPEYRDGGYPGLMYVSEYDRSSPPTNVTITSTKRESVNRPSASSSSSLVSERIKRLENPGQEGMEGKSSYAGSTDSSRSSSSSSGLKTKHFDSVASRAAFFEQKQSSVDSVDGNTATKRKISIEINSGSPHRSVEPYSEDTYRLKPDGPTSVSIYFRNPEPSHARLPPSREIMYGSPIHIRHSSDSSGGTSDSLGSSSWGQMQGQGHGEMEGRDRSPVALQDAAKVNEDQEFARRRVAKRQPSYLTAIHSPLNKSPPEDPFGSGSQLVAPSSPSVGTEVISLAQSSPAPSGGSLFGYYNTQMPVMLEEDEDGLSAVSVTPDEFSKASAATPGSDPQSINYRNRMDDRDKKLVRRTSYLMATHRDSSNLKLQLKQPPAADGSQQPHPHQQQPHHQQPPQPSPAADETQMFLQPHLPPGGAQQQQLDLPGQQDHEQPTTPTKPVSLKKLKAFFGERTPRIIEATLGKQDDIPSPIADVTKEGWLNSKLAVSDGKRASDRSWKPMWAVLRGHALYLHKEKTTPATMPNFPDEHPVSIKSSIVDIAHDYTKKKNVFRLITYNGSEYLFQAEDQTQETMMAWIRAIQANNNPDDDKGVASSDLIIRKTNEYEQTLQVKNSPQVAPKGKEIKEFKDTKKSVTRGLRARSPGSHSPAVKHRKPDKDHVESPKSKDTKTWKGKITKKFKRYGSSSAPSVDQEVEYTGTFGIPLEMCVMSPTHEFVPLVVEVCTTVVEERGLEVVGIYRVPGNAAAVNSLQEEVNKDPETINLEENERWQDVNVVGSLLKSYFRKLPEPMVIDDLYDSFITANRQENPEKRMLLIKKLLHDLPEHHFETFHYLATHLNKVAINGEINKMDARNLAIVFGPTLIRKIGDSMVTMVKDMSDQCRIIESVILHPDWFFSSWDVDSYVPIDEEIIDATPVSGMNQKLLSKAECLEYGISESSPKGKEIKHKELVSSIIHAANRKARKKDIKKITVETMSSVEAESVSEGYNERNIDEEIAARKGKLTTVQSQSVVSTLTSSSMSKEATKKSASTSALQSMSQSSSTDTVQESIFNAKMAFLGATGRNDSSENMLSRVGGVTSTSASALNNPESTLSTSSGTATSSSSSAVADPDVKIKYYVKKFPAYPCAPMPYTENTKPRMLRRYSEEMLRDRQESPAKITIHNLNRSWGLPASTQEHLNRLQKETELMRQKENQRSAERALAKQRIEQEMQKTRRELEMEESLEDLLAKPTEVTLPLSENSKRGGGGGGANPDAVSLTSEYSSTSSTNYTYDSKSSGHSGQTGAGYGGYGSGVAAACVAPYSASGKSRATVEGYRAVADQGGYSDSGEDAPLENCSGRYFQLVNAHHPKRTPSHSSRDDLDIYTVHSVKHHKTPPMFDSYKVAGRGTVSRKKLDSRSEAARAGKEAALVSPSEFQHSGMMGKRKSSLDSLLDFYEHADPHSGSSSVSDENELLTSLTSTFDEKLKFFLPKEEYTTSPPSLQQQQQQQQQQLERRLSPERKTLSLGAESKTRSSSQGMATGSVNTVGMGNRQLSDNVFLESSFRDPSLHRLHSVKSETKIGIASRFERNKPSDAGIGAADSSAPVPADPVTSGLVTSGFSSDEKSLSSRTTASNENPTEEGKAWVALPPKLCSVSTSSSSAPKQQLQQPPNTEQKTTMSKTEKTDTNLSRQGQRSGDIVAGDGGDNRSVSEGREMGGGGDTRSSETHTTTTKRRSNSPPVKLKDIMNQKTRRRHTVGGTNDLEHFKALCFLNQVNKSDKPPEQKLSAWDRLQPAVKPVPSENRTMHSWIQRERLRTSSPDILSLALSQAPSGDMDERSDSQVAERHAKRRGTDGDLLESFAKWQENRSPFTRKDSQSSMAGSCGGSSYTFESAI